MRRPRVSPTCFLLSILLLHPSVSAQTTRNVTLLSHLNSIPLTRIAGPISPPPLPDGREYVAVGSRLEPRS